MSNFFQTTPRLKLIAAGGLLVSVIALWFSWVSVSVSGASSGANGWDGGFQIADWLGGTSAIDAWLILLLAAAGLYLELAPVFGKALPALKQLPASVPTAMLPAIAGGIIALIGLAEFRYVGDFAASTPGLDAATAKQFGVQVSISRGFGLYLEIIGGAATAVAAFMDARGMTLGGK